MKVRTKICGITRIEDLRCAVRAGVDAIGFVFYAPSPRSVTAKQAQNLIQEIPPYVQVVGLFVNAPLTQIQATLDDAYLDIFQFHGDESPQQCQHIAQHFKKRWYKAIQVKPDLDLIAEIQRYQDAGASAILLDAWHPDLKGGTGQQFDWSQFPKLQIPLILAGGLTPENITTAIDQTQPFAVDVSGGVEASKGIKDHQKIVKFMQGVHSGSAK